MLAHTNIGGALTYRDALSQLKNETGLSNDALAERLGYSNAQKIRDVNRGMEPMSWPAVMCLCYLITILKNNPQLVEKAQALFKQMKGPDK